MSSEGNSFSEPLHSQPWQIHSSITNTYTPIHNVPVWLRRSVQARSYSDTCTQIPLQGAEMSVFSVYWFHILPVAWESRVDGALAIPEANRFHLV